MKPLSLDQLISVLEKLKVSFSGVVTTITKLPENEKSTTAQLTVQFDSKNPDPKAWKALAILPLEEGVSVNIYGTRISSGSGAIDGTLQDCYRRLLPEVNSVRVSRGLPEIRN